jgi:hypothetical protein
MNSNGHGYLTPACSSPIDSRGPLHCEALNWVDLQCNISNKCLKVVIVTELIATQNGPLGLISDK